MFHVIVGLFIGLLLVVCIHLFFFSLKRAWRRKVFGYPEDELIKKQRWRPFFNTRMRITWLGGSYWKDLLLN